MAALVPVDNAALQHWTYAPSGEVMVRWLHGEAAAPTGAFGFGALNCLDSEDRLMLPHVHSR
jgi:hypothetical protein